MDALQEVFAGTSLLRDQRRVEALLITRAEIEAAWGTAAKGFILAGRRLLELDEQLVSPEERMALKAGCERLFPFSEPIATQLRAVARAVDAGVLSFETCPASYSAAYQITLLKPPLLEKARRQGLIAPRTTRAALIAFRKQHEPRPEAQIDVLALSAEERRIKVSIAKLDIKRQSLESRLVEIQRILKSVPETA
jgi:hypothetical protein